MTTPYQLLDMNESVGRIRFEGRFENRPVTWDATITRLPPDEDQYIVIGTPVGGLWPIEIGLRVERIDAGVLHKAVIMIRQYRRLRRGHYRFG